MPPRERSWVENKDGGWFCWVITDRQVTDVSRQHSLMAVAQLASDEWQPDHTWARLA